jgi:hypothetical protein
MEPAAKKPTSVTVIGWIFIVVSGLMLLSGAMGLVSFSLMKKMSGGEFPPMVEGMPGAFKASAFMFKHFGLIAFLQILFAGFSLFAGIQFLRLRSWARTALEVIAWLGLTYIIGFGIFWIISWVSITSAIPAEGAAAPPAAFNIIGAIMGAVVIAIFAVPAIVIIIFLRKPEVRRAVSL